jgi:hypothetical protein
MIRERFFKTVLSESLYDKYSDLLEDQEEYDVSISFEIDNSEFRLYSLDIYYAGAEVEDLVLRNAEEDLPEEEQRELIEYALSNDEYLENTEE